MLRTVTIAFRALLHLERGLHLEGGYIPINIPINIPIIGKGN